MTVCAVCGREPSNRESDPHGAFGYHKFTPKAQPPPPSKQERLRDAATRAAVWQTIEARAKELKDEARSELSGIEVGETVAAKWNGQLLAKASMPKGRAKLVVTDEAALLSWVQDHHPTEIVVTVNPAFLKAVETLAKERGAPVDSQGELIPGLELAISEPSVSVRKEPDALGIVAEMLRAGQLQFDGIKSLEAN